MMDRRAFIGTLAGGLLAAPLAVQAQPAQKIFRVGYLAGGGRTPDGAPPGPLRESLRSLGSAEGKNVALGLTIPPSLMQRADQVIE